MHKSSNGSSWTWVVGWIILAISCAIQAASPSSTASDPAPKARLVETYGKLPLSFEFNQGQTGDPVRFLSRGPGYGVFLTPTETVLSFPAPGMKAPGQSPAATKAPERAPSPPAGQRQPPSPVSRETTGETRHTGTKTQPRSVLRMQLVGANPRPRISGVDPLPGKVNYFRGNDPKRWRTNVPTYAKVKYEKVYPGIDLVYYGNQRQLEHDFVVAPGANPKTIRLAFDGAERLVIDAQGDLVLKTAGGDVRLRKPRVYQDINGQQREIEGRYILRSARSHGKGSLGFQVVAYDKTQPLVIDPVLVYSTYLGGNSSDVGLAITVDSTGNAYVAGTTSSINFPMVNAFQGVLAGGFGGSNSDAFLIKFNPSGQVVYSTYLGGSGREGSELHLAVDNAGNAYLKGIVVGDGSGFPLVNAFSTNPEADFLTKFDALGQVVYSTFLGNSSGYAPFPIAVAVDDLGNAYVTGATASSSFPVVNAFQSTYAGSYDGYVAKLGPTGEAIYSTYLGGSNSEQFLTIALDDLGNAYVTGATNSSDFPMVNAAFNYKGDSDAFVTKFNPAGRVVYSTYLGSSAEDASYSIAVDRLGNAIITGIIRGFGSPPPLDFPLVNAFDGSITDYWFVGYSDGFVTKLDSNGQIVFSTYLGGSNGDLGYTVRADSVGNAYVIGSTSSTDFPVVNAFNGNRTGGGDLFLSKFGPTGQAIYSSYVGGYGGYPYNLGVNLALDGAANAYITGYGGTGDAFVTKVNSVGQAVYTFYLGGGNIDRGIAIAVDSVGNAYVTGLTYSVDFPIQNAFQVNKGGGDTDAFVAKISDTAPPSPQPILSIAPPSLDFGSRTIGTTSAAQTVTLTNSGTADLMLGALSLAGANPGDYTFVLNGCGGKTLLPSAHCTFSVAFKPNAVGPLSAVVQIPSNAPEGLSTVVLSGSGYVPAQSTVAGPTGCAIAACSAEPVNTATGNYFYQHTDLTLPGRGLPLAFTRTLNVQDSSSGPFGPGWTHSYHLVLTEKADGSVVIRMGDGHEEFYDPAGGGAYQPHDPGVFNILVKNADGSFHLTQKNQTRMAFTAAGRLTTISDRNGNALSFAYDGSGHLATVTDPVGRILTLSYDAGGHVVSITDPIGRIVQYAYDASGRLISDTDPKGGLQRYQYDADGLLTTITDRRGNTLVANTYDAGKRVVTQTNGKGAVTRFAYDTPAAGQTSMTDPLGRVTVHTHDILRRLVQETDPLGQAVSTVYDANNNRIQVTNRNGKVTAFTYDAQGNVTSRTDAQGNVTAIQYNSLNDPTRIVDALGQVTTFAYDAKGNLTEVTDALNQETRIAYDAFGQPVSVTDPRGVVTSNTFDANGNLVQVQDGLGQKTSFAYDAIGRRTGLTDANGRTAGFAYDNNGNLISVTDPLGNTTAYAYDANNNRTGMTDPRGNTTNFAYDANDLPSQATDPLGNFAQFVYDAADNRIKVTDPRGNLTQYAYDAADRLIRVTDALGEATQLAYDANGNLLTQTNPLGHAASFAYDELNRLVSATDALSHQGFRTYDALGRLIQSKDASGHITQYAYDALGRLVKVTDPAGGIVAYAYDAVGNRTAITDPNGHTTTMAYDALSRLVQKTDPLGNQYQYAHDAVGNRISLTDAKGQVLEYAYDANNRLIQIAYPDASLVQFTYDAAGNRTQMTDKLGVSGYVYDALNRLTAYTDPFGKTVANEYDKAGNRTALVYPDGKRVTYAYDALNRMASVTDWLGGVTTYSYDAASNLAEVLNPNNTKASYGYDAAERLVNLANAKADTTVLASYALTLDAVGNRTGIDRTEPLAPILTSKTQTLTYDNDNRLLTLDAAAVTHDPNGNLTAEPGKTLQYDFEDRLVAATGNQTAQFDYDGVGNRLAANRNGQTTRYTLDVTGPLSNVLVENDGAGNPTAYYVHGLGLTSQITPSGDAHYYHYDTIGSTVALTDAAGNVTDKYAYDPFGQIPNSQESVNNQFRYVGQFGVMEEGNGLKFMRARYYEAGVGRFVNKDSFLFSTIFTQQVNRYNYALNSPVAFSDPSGLFSWSASLANLGKGTLSLAKDLALGAADFSVALKEGDTRGAVSAVVSTMDKINTTSKYFYAWGSCMAGASCDPSDAPGIYDNTIVKPVIHANRVYSAFASIYHLRTGKTTNEFDNAIGSFLDSRSIANATTAFVKGKKFFDTVMIISPQSPIQQTIRDLNITPIEAQAAEMEQPYFQSLIVSNDTRLIGTAVSRK